ncbi:YjcZ family sporulation protein [Paenibacillus sp. FSL H8-0261]
MSENVAGFGGGYGGGIGGAFTSTGAILVLFILLVIISKTICL